MSESGSALTVKEEKKVFTPINRSIGLNSWALNEIKGATVTETGFVDIGCEGKEPLFTYVTTTQKTYHEVILTGEGGIRIGLCYDNNGHLGELVPEST